MFASWDGEAIGELGSTSWMNVHRGELRSRAVAHIDIDFEIQQAKGSSVAASPLLR